MILSHCYFHKNNFFHQLMVDFVNKLEFNYNKYKTNGTLKDEIYKENS